MAESTLAQDFVAGIDPFGVYTSQYGQEAEQAGVSEARHATKKLVGTAGGVFGGAVVVPTALGGIAKGVSKFMQPGSRGTRLARGIGGFIEGASTPWKMLYDTRVARRALRRARQTGGTTLSDRERAAFGTLIKSTPVGALLGGGKTGFLQKLRDAHGAFGLSRGRLSKSFADRISAPVDLGYKAGVGTLALGGVVGGGGASVQYAKGRQSEKKFQRRLNMQKMGSVEAAALEAAYLLELEKISSVSKAKDLAYRLGRSVRTVTDIPLKGKDIASSIRESYGKGYRKVPRNLSELAEQVPASALMLPIFLGGGIGLSAAAKSKLKKKEQPESLPYGISDEYE